MLGGDHSVAVGTVAGVSRVLRENGEKIGLIWIDAHADMNTSGLSPSGNVHGMPLACCIGDGPAGADGHVRLRAEGGSAQRRARRAARRGLRKSRTCEAPALRAFTMRDIDERGMRAVMPEAIEIAYAMALPDFICRSTWTRGSRVSAGRRHAGARRIDVSGGAPGDGN